MSWRKVESSNEYSLMFSVMTYVPCLNSVVYITDSNLEFVQLLNLETLKSSSWLLLTKLDPRKAKLVASITASRYFIGYLNVFN